MKTTTILALLTLTTLIGCDKKPITAKQPAQETAKANVPTPTPPPAAVATTKPVPAPPTPPAPTVTPAPVPAPPK